MSLHLNFKLSNWFLLIGIFLLVAVWIGLQRSELNSATLLHRRIVTTVFWIGEPASRANGYIANYQSAWDEHWLQHYGGIDDPVARQGYRPAGFKPRTNPFYAALPYDSEDNASRHKPEAKHCLDLSGKGPDTEHWCQDVWLKISHKGRIAYAQWQDVGPFNENDSSYVWGPARPAITQGEQAGLDVSPAVKDYLGLQDVDYCDWSFIKTSKVPGGPWKAH